MSAEKCPACGHLWLRTVNGAGCLTKGCLHSLLLGRGEKQRKPKPPPPREEKK